MAQDPFSETLKDRAPVLTTMLPFVYTGSGSPVLFDVRYQGSDPFRIFVVDAIGGDYERLLTTRPNGPYTGVRALSYRNNTFEEHTEEIAAFKIRVEGEGAWQVRVGLPALAANAITSATGTGDKVIGPFNLTSTNPSRRLHFRGYPRWVEVLGPADRGWDAAAADTATDLAFTNRRRPVNVYASGNADKGPDDLPYGSYVRHSGGRAVDRLVE